MRPLLFLTVVVALLCCNVGTTKAQVPCNNPFFRLLEGRAWEFAYRALSALDLNPNTVCPTMASQQSCCDALVYDALAAHWVTLYAEVVGIKIKLDVLQIEVGVLLVEIAAAKNHVNNDPNLTQAEKNALNSFLDAVAAAVAQLVPMVRDNFVQCYSTVLKFYAGLLCKACDPDWSDWVHVNGSDPTNDDFEFRFAAQTCTTFQEDCSPFFAPFFQFANTLFAAAANLASQIPDNKTRENVLDKLESFRPPCLDSNDCLEFICFQWLRGLDRLEDWAEHAFENATDHRRRFATDSAIQGLNKVQRSALGVANALRAASPLTATKFTGSFDPISQATTLNTNANSNSDSGSTRAIKSFMLDLLV